MYQQIAADGAPCAACDNDAPSAPSHWLPRGRGLLTCIAAVLSVALLSHFSGRPAANLAPVGPRDFLRFSALPPGMTEVTDSVFSNCDKQPVIVDKTLLHNNFGGMGPDQGEEGIVIQAVMKNKADNTSTPVNIEFHNTSEYTPPSKKFAEQWNGMKDGFCTISLKVGTKVQFTINGIDPDTDEAKQFDDMFLSFFDIDTGKTSVESINVSTPASYFLTNDSTVKMKENANDVMTLEATQQGTGNDNPTSDEKLSRVAETKSVTVEYKKLTDLPIGIGATDGTANRVFYFSFRPSLICAQRTTKDNPDKFVPAGSPGTKTIMMKGAGPQKCGLSWGMLTVVAAVCSFLIAPQSP